MDNGSTVATAPAIVKIQVPNFSKMVWGAIKGAVVDTWNKVEFRNDPRFYAVLIGIAAIIVIWILLWFYRHFWR
jgi:hypothetical protein